MTRPEITAKLSSMLEKKINPHNDPRIYWAKEVTFDYSTDHAVRVDYMRFVPVHNSISGIEKGDNLWLTDIDKNKDKILNIEYKIDEEIALELDGKEIDIKDAIKNIDIKELEI